MSLHKKFSDDQLTKIVNESTSIKDLCQKLGYKSSTSYYRDMKARLDKLGIKVVKKVTNYKHTDGAVIEAAKGARSITAIMRRLGMCPTGWAHERFKARLVSLGVDIKSMPGARWNKGSIVGPKRPITDYLVNNGPITNSSKLRKRLAAEGLLENKCDECGQGPMWRDKPLSLQLDHMNGNRLDNRLENLRILCPNCHSQTENHSKQKAV